MVRSRRCVSVFNYWKRNYMSETTEPTPEAPKGMAAFIEALHKKDKNGKSLSDYMEESAKKYSEDADVFWDGLSEEDRLKAFYSVCKRIHKGDVIDRGSYRYVLYDIFGFNFDAYTIGMNCGYLDIHNYITTPEDEALVNEQYKIAQHIVESEQFMWLMAGSNHVESQLQEIRPAYMAWKDAGGKNILKKET